MQQLPPLDTRVRAAWQTQVAAAVNTPGLLPAVAQRRQQQLPRFAACYPQLRALPRRVRRALQRQWKQSLAGIALLLALGQGQTLAATLNVSGGCTLLDAITAANTDAATGGCSAGSGADTIVLQNSSLHTLTAVNNSSGVIAGQCSGNCLKRCHRSVIQCQPVCATSADRMIVPIRSATMKRKKVFARL